VLVTILNVPSGDNEMSALEILVENSPEDLTPACKIHARRIFSRPKQTGYFMRVAPTSYLLNSKTVQESINDNKILVLNLYTGTVFFIKGEEMVRPVASANLRISK
jgi:hypothetical protein